MITLEGRPYRVCNGVSRRDILRVGTLGIAGFGLADLLKLRAEAAPTAGRATSIVMIHLGGGPSQLDTYDPKPDAPVEYRGEFKAIGTNVPGVQICEHFPLQARMMDRLAVLRSVYGGPDDHASSHTTTGYSNVERVTQGDKPSMGSVLTRIRGNARTLIPAYTSLRPVNRESGLGAAYLGGEYEPFVFDGPGRDDLHLRIRGDRLAHRRKVLEQIDGFRKSIDARAVSNQDAFARRAFEVVSSTAAYEAFDLSKEKDETRKRYGNDQLLLTRRLLEAGVQSVALEIGGWDTHSNNFAELKRLLPQLDQGFSAFIQDLHLRGLLEHTIVVMWGEFGRTPKVNNAAGRDHWPRVMSAVVAGGAFKTGQVIGASDPTGAEPASDPCKIRAVIASIYHALGIDPASTFIDQGRPVQLIQDAEPIPQLFG